MMEALSIPPVNYKANVDMMNTGEHRHLQLRFATHAKRTRCSLQGLTEPFELRRKTGAAREGPPIELGEQGVERSHAREPRDLVEVGEAIEQLEREGRHQIFL